MPDSYLLPTDENEKSTYDAKSVEFIFEEACCDTLLKAKSTCPFHHVSLQPMPGFSDSL